MSMNVTIGRGNSRRTVRDIRTGTFPKRTKERVEVEQTGEQLKNFLFRPKMFEH